MTYRSKLRRAWWTWKLNLLAAWFLAGCVFTGSALMVCAAVMLVVIFCIAVFGSPFEQEMLFRGMSEGAVTYFCLSPFFMAGGGFCLFRLSLWLEDERSHAATSAVWDYVRIKHEGRPYLVNPQLQLIYEEIEFLITAREQREEIWSFYARHGQPQQAYWPRYPSSLARGFWG